MKKTIPPALIVILVLLICTVNAAQTDQNSTPKNVTMYYFWQIGCAHCQEIEPFIGTLEKKYPQLDLKKFEVSKSQENSQLFYDTAEAYGKTAKITPTIFVDDYMIEGYNSWITEQRIESAVINCTEKKCASPGQKLQEYKNNHTISTTTQETTTTSSTTTTTTTTTTSSTTTTTTTATTTTTTAQTTTTTNPTTSTIPQPEKKDNTQILAPLAVAVLALSALLVRRPLKPGKPEDLIKKSQ